MARCESVDFLRQNVLGNKTEKMETSDESDSDSDISYILDLDMSGDKDSNSDSPESVHNDEEQMITHPVLSLKCLHEDTDEEPESSNGGNDDYNSKFIDANEVPELSLKYLDKDDLQDIQHETGVGNEEKEHPNLVPVKIVTEKVSSNVLSTPVVHPVSRIPARSNWDGAHNFKIKLDCTDNPRKTESPVYSESRNKLYVCKDHPFKILVTAESVPMGSMIKVTAIFSMVEHSYEVVRRCPTHAQQDFLKANRAYEHFVQCFSDAAVYEKNNENGRMSVSVPYEKPQDGESCTTYLYKLTCFSSCSGGISRRPFTIIFTLENNNIPLGRQVLYAKVCACPLRDFKVDLAKEEKKKSRADSNKSAQSSNPEKITSNYSITVKDPQLYQFLKQMKVLYETSACLKVIPDT